MKLLITGGLGHIGSRLLRELPALIPKSDLVIADNLATQRFCSLFDLPDAASYTFIEADILTADMRALVNGVDAVIHLAAITEAAGSFEKQTEVEEVNFVGTQKVAEACAQAGVPLLFISSTSVYGGTKDTVCEDDEESLLPQTPYADSKLRAERMLRTMALERGLVFTTLRFGTIVGPSPGMRFHTAANKFAWQACLGLPITVWKTALFQKRPYLDLGDAVRAIAFFLQKRIFDQTEYNIVTGNCTVSQILEWLRHSIPDLKISEIDSKAMNSLSFDVQRNRAEQLGFEFRGSLEDGIAATVKQLKAIAGKRLAE